MSRQIVSIESAVGWKEKLLAGDKYYFKTLQPSMLAEDMAVVCNDLTSGLPAEIEARRKQYEYYRDKLLSFKEVSA